MSACSTSRGINKPSLDVMAYPSAYVNWENAALDSNEDKPVVRALELLSRTAPTDEDEAGRARSSE
jgi:hypothetical protein